MVARISGGVGMIHILGHDIKPKSIVYVSPISETQKSHIKFMFTISLSTGKDILIEVKTGWWSQGKLTEHIDKDGRLVRNERSNIQEVYQSEQYSAKEKEIKQLREELILKMAKWYESNF